MIREAEFAVEDLFVDSEWVVVEEGWIAGEELEEEDTVGPVIGCSTVSCCGDAVDATSQRVPFVRRKRGGIGEKGEDVHLWCEVLWGTAERISTIGNIFRKSKIGNLQIALSPPDQSVSIPRPSTVILMTYGSVNEKILRLEISINDIVLM